MASAATWWGAAAGGGAPEVLPIPQLPPGTLSHPSLQAMPAVSPRVKVSTAVDDEAEAAEELGAWARRRGVERPFVIASRRSALLASRLPAPAGRLTPPPVATEGWARTAGVAAREAGADVVVAVGGGRCLDAAKVAAAEAGLTCIAVPTQLSHDGICSPVAVLPAVAGEVARSLPCTAPSWAFFSRPTLLRSPIAAIRAGLGDLLSNPLALLDWELADLAGEEPINPSAWHMAAEAYVLVEPILCGSLGPAEVEPWVIGRLAHALSASGLAMLLAGSSRPASGAEHKISHAIDELHGHRALHGAQVAFACTISAALHGLEVAPVTAAVERLGLPSHPRQLGLSADDLVRVLLRAPATRPGRRTVLEHVDLDERGARRVVRGLWPDA